MVPMMPDHGAHICALPVQIEEKRPSLLSATLITESFESRHNEGRVEGERGGDGGGAA